MYRYFHSFSGIIPARAGFTSSRPTATPIRPDHPRSRGVYRRVRLTRACGPGSSPLARGLLFLAFRTHNSVRIIPARAGFTHNRITCANAVQDHPRSRGVYALRALRLSGLHRIIPARAGFTDGQGRQPAGRGDHPRSRGVYAKRLVKTDIDAGSSPLARGLLILFGSDGGGDGIIPARAGFTPQRNRSSQPVSDHPRSRGVYPISRTCFQNRPGSSPLARGLRRWEPPANSVTRIIPARAGFTGIDSRWHDQWGDHPRSRGVYEPTSWPPSTTRGSSPLARGLRELARLGELRLRIIPARAGFTCESEDADGPCRDHPRSRGVYAD